MENYLGGALTRRRYRVEAEEFCLAPSKLSAVSYPPSRMIQRSTILQAK